MTTEKAGPKNGHEEKFAAMDCCSPQKLAGMMAKCAKDQKCGCFPMMKGRCCSPEEN